jgi:hypothetical protein
VLDLRKLKGHPMKHILTAFLITLMASSSNASNLTLGQVLAASEPVRKFESSEQPMLAVRVKLNIDGTDYVTRHVVYDNKQDQNQTLGEALGHHKLLDTSFSPVLQQNVNAIYVAASSELKSQGLNFVISLGPVAGMPKVMPTISQVIDACAELNQKKPNDLSLAKITIDGKTFPLRYFRFESKRPDTHQVTFASFVEAHDKGITEPDKQLRNAEAEIETDEFKTIHKFVASDEMKASGVDYVISLGEPK